VREHPHKDRPAQSCGSYKQA
jgi:hypothetical protein